MTNREKVIKGLEYCATNRLRREDCEAMDCVYLDIESHGCIHQIIRDALALLKAQEPVKPISCKSYIHTEPIAFDYECPICMTGIMRNWVACPNCGQAVKWDG